MISGRLSRRSTLAATAISIFVLLYLYKHFDLAADSLAYRSPVSHSALHCATLRKADDTVVILKTGSTELQDKLPIHLKTTLKCYPNHLIFSDYAERYGDETILDALEDVDPVFQNSHEDFALWRQLQKGGRASLNPSELSGPASYPQHDTVGKPTNPGWRLDKWKFLPMIRKTLQTFPDKEWYVFVETDTYIFWSTLLAYLETLDSTQKHYIGAQNEIDDTIYAHGGSGFVISRPALEAAVEFYVENQAEWEAITANNWAGDCVLGKALFDSGTKLTWAWPIFQGRDIGLMNYSEVDYSKRLWCYPSVSYHHLTPTAIEDLWRHEQSLISKPSGGESRPPPLLRHKDVFAQYILPQTTEPRSDWYNHADEYRGLVSSLDECRSICEGEVCLQYAIDQKGSCLVTAWPRLGEAKPGMQSGWMQERMRLFHDTAATCEGEDWIV